MNKFFFSLLLSNFCFLSLTAAEGITLAKDYQNNSGFQWKSAIESLKKFPFDEKDKILDIGSGNGKITAWVAEQVPKGLVVGLDISEAMLAYATANFYADNLVYVQGSATSIPFTQQFDKIVSFYALHWVVAQEQALSSLRNALKVGGSILLVVPGKTGTNLGVVCEKMVYSAKWLPYFTNFVQEKVYFTPDEYRELLVRAQLEIQSFEVIEATTTYKDKNALIAHIRPLVNFIDHLTPLQQTDFIKDLIARQLLDRDLILNMDGSIDVQTTKFEIIAHKSL